MMIFHCRASVSLRSGSVGLPMRRRWYTRRSHSVGQELWLKLECMKPSGAFKLSGALSAGAYLLARSHEVLGDYPNVAEARGAGMLAAVEFAEDPGARRFFDPV